MSFARDQKVPEAYWDPESNARNGWYTFRNRDTFGRYAINDSSPWSLQINLIAFDRWMRLQITENNAVFVAGTPPPGRSQPPLTLFCFKSLLQGHARVPWEGYYAIVISDSD
jgi:hypothetical protein